MRLLLTSITIFLTACSSTPATQLTPLELQSLQSRDYDTTKQIAFAATMSVFQDLSYTVEAADLDTGLITASSNAQSKRAWFLSQDYQTTQTRATAFVEEISPGSSRIRLNFVAGKLTSFELGSERKTDNQILDPATYQAAFEKIETAIFVRQ